MRSASCYVLAAASSAASVLGLDAPRSLAPLYASLVEDPIIIDVEAALRHRALHGGRRLELTTTNTNPIRLALDFTSLDKATAPQYSACFAVGDWFRRGLPRLQAPPTDGVPTCERGANEYASAKDGCWGLCAAGDVISAAMRSKVIGVVTVVASEMSAFLAVETASVSLKFSVDMGRYQRALTERGYTPVEGCAADCTALSSVAVAAVYCTTGVDADAVLSVTRPPSITGVMGTGSSCAQAANSRPTWLTLAWMDGFDDTRSTLSLINEYRGFVRHEIMHALGFQHSSFTYARDSAGTRKALLQLVQVTDADGETDKIWHFRRGTRAYEMAQTYFGCSDDLAWDGLPLMGMPEIGRNSHWETRVLRDDVMSYGGQALVSPITLAAMEDLGFYLANYSAANCMSWGYKQGCAYVRSRCSAATVHDQSAATTSSSDCMGDPAWISRPQPYLAAKCAGGDRPCASSVGRGYTSIGALGPACDAQCYTPPRGRADCSAGPAGAVQSSAPKSIEEFAEAYIQYIWIGALVLGVIVVLVCLNTFCCPKKGSIALTATMTVFICLAGIAVAGAGAYSYFFNRAIIAAFVGGTSLIGLMVFGGALIALSFVTFLGLCCRSRLLFGVVFVVYLILLLVEIAFAGMIAYWVYTLNHVTASTFATLSAGAASDGKYDGRIGETALAEVESVMCRTYQTCCRDAMLDANQTCLSAHEGSTVDIATSMLDPASANFCPYISGSSGMLTFTPPPGACLAIDWVLGDFSLSVCQAKFCAFGYEGYEGFVKSTIGWMMSNGYYLGAGCTGVLLIQLVLAVNVFRLSRTFGKRTKVGPRGAGKSPPPRP